MDALSSALLFLGAATWIGGLVTVFVVVAAARAALAEADRVAMMRAVGRRFLNMMGVAGVVMLLGAAWRLRHHGFDAAMAAAVATVVVLVVVLVVGVAQARAMGRLREAALAGAGAGTAEAGTADEPGVARAARRAAVLRGGIVVLSVALVVQGALLLAD